MNTPLPIEQSDPEFANLLKWYYESGIREHGITIYDVVDNIPVVRDKKVNRNDPCPCNSGNKYKKCCGGKI